MLRKLLALAIVAALLLALDQGARLFAEGKIESRARAEVPQADEVSAEISSFPFLGRLLTSGSVPRVRVRVTEAPVRAVVLAAVDVDLRGVELKRDALFGGDVQLEDIDRGSVAVELDAASISRVVNVPVSVGGGAVRVTVAGRTVTATPEARGGSLLLRVAGLPVLTVPIARTSLVSCTAADVAVEGDRVRLTCEVDEVPPGLRR